MKLLFFLLAIFFSQTLSLDAGQAQSIFDSIKSKLKKEADHSLDEAKENLKKSAEEPTQNDDSQDNGAANQESSKAFKGSIKDADKLELYGGHSAPWNVAPKGSTRVQDVEIKGIRLGMPEILIDEIMAKEGFEKTGLTQYSKDIVELNGEQKEVTPSQQQNKTAAERGELIKRYIIAYKSVAVDDELLNELEEPLKTQIAQGRKKFDQIKEKYAQQRAVSRDRRTMAPRPKYDKYPQDTSAFKLVYEFQYTQYFAHGSQYDKKALMGQIENIFGQPTYAPISSHARSGSAFGTDEYSWLIYHDAALVPVAKREALLVGVNKKGDRWAMKNAFSHPCGASPYENNMNCVAAPITSAYTDLSKRLEAARIIYAPVMMVNFKSPSINTKLAWEYIKSAPSIREYFNKTNAYKKLPKAKVDF